MNAIINSIFEHAHMAHYIGFFALLLAGLNFPISEDLIIIIGGVIASTVIPENTYKIFLAIFLGCYISDSITYWIGRKLGRRLYRLKWFSKLFSPKKLHKTQKYYLNHGFKTLLIGRFIPFGIRNCLFFTAGMGKMKYGRFLLSDGISCILSNIFLFVIAYNLGKNFDSILKWMKTFHIFIFLIFIAIFSLIIYKYKKRKNQKSCKT